MNYATKSPNNFHILNLTTKPASSFRPLLNDDGSSYFRLYWQTPNLIVGDEDLFNEGFQG